MNAPILNSSAVISARRVSDAAARPLVCSIYLSLCHHRDFPDMRSSPSISSSRSAVGSPPNPLSGVPGPSIMTSSFGSIVYRILELSDDEEEEEGNVFDKGFILNICLDHVGCLYRARFWRAEKYYKVGQSLMVGFRRANIRRPTGCKAFGCVQLVGNSLKQSEYRRMREVDWARLAGFSLVRPAVWRWVTQDTARGGLNGRPPAYIKDWDFCSTCGLECAICV